VAAPHVEQDPREVGVDPDRMARADAHLARYVDDGRLAGWQLAVTRRGRVVHAGVGGSRDLEAGLPVEPDTLWRIYSMTKPITAVPRCSSTSRAGCGCTDEVSATCPIADMRVLVGGNASSRRPCRRPGAGPAVAPAHAHRGADLRLTRSSVLDDMYRAAHADPLSSPTPAWPRWSTAGPACADVPARHGLELLGGHRRARPLVEVVTGQPLDQVMSEQVLEPLGMTDTRWWVDAADAGRWPRSTCRTPGPAAWCATTRWAGTLREPRCCPAGAGWCRRRPTTRGSRRCCSAVARSTARGCSAADAALHDPQPPARRRHAASLGRGQFAEATYDGVGFGLGFSVSVDPVATKVTTTVGEHAWGGLASTAFWVDPAEELAVHFFTQLVPSSTYPLRTELRQLVYAALVD
jgi:CubicO group peptidase (beta-lactamase class C family)